MLRDALSASNGLRHEDGKKEVARLATQYLEGELSWQDFILRASPENETDDEDISELWASWSTPKQGGFLGVSKQIHDAYMSRIRELIAKLDTSAP